jgi:hypothetical protein
MPQFLCLSCQTTITSSCGMSVGGQASAKRRWHDGLAQPAKLLSTTAFADSEGARQTRQIHRILGERRMSSHRGCRRRRTLPHGAASPAVADAAQTVFAGTGRRTDGLLRTRRGQQSVTPIQVRSSRPDGTRPTSRSRRACLRSSARLQRRTSVCRDPAPSAAFPDLHR